MDGEIADRCREQPAGTVRPFAAAQHRHQLAAVLVERPEQPPRSAESARWTPDPRSTARAAGDRRIAPGVEGVGEVRPAQTVLGDPGQMRDQVAHRPLRTRGNRRASRSGSRSSPAGARRPSSYAQAAFHRATRSRVSTREGRTRLVKGPGTPGRPRDRRRVPGRSRPPGRGRSAPTRRTIRSARRPAASRHSWYPFRSPPPANVVRDVPGLLDRVADALRRPGCLKWPASPTQRPAGSGRLPVVTAHHRLRDHDDRRDRARRRRAAAGSAPPGTGGAPPR